MEDEVDRLHVTHIKEMKISLNICQKIWRFILKFIVNGVRECESGLNFSGLG
jgi:hypothetical protein